MKKTFLKSILLSTLTLVSLFSCGDGFKFIFSGLDKPSKDNTQFTNSADINENNTSRQDDKKSNSDDQSNIDDGSEFTIFSVNDFHGKIEATNAYNGLLALQGAIRGNPKYTEDSPIVSAGDMWQGTYVSGFDKGESLTKLMNDFPISAMALGNHEFDWGFNKIESNQNEANYTFLCANLIQKSTRKRPDSIKDHIVLDIDGFKLGVVGAMGAELESSIKSSRIEDFEFSNDTNLLKDAITSCEEEGAKSTILILHDDKDSTYTNTIQSSKLNFKGIFGGHSHSFQLEKSNSIIPYVQGGCDSNGYSYMTFSKTTGALKDINYVNVDSSMASNATMDLTQKTNNLINSIPTIIYGESKGRWNKTNTTNFVLQAMFYAAKKNYPDKNYTTKTLVALHNNSGIRGSFTSGQMTNKTVQTVSPFDNVVTILPNREVNGTLLETVGSGQKRPYCTSYPNSSSWTTKRTMDIVTIDYLVSDRYSAALSPTKPTPAINLENDNGEDYIIYDVVADYIKYLCQDGNVINAADYN